MTMEELGRVCEQAARDLAGRHGRPLPAAVVLPMGDATKVATLPDFPADDEGRMLVLGGFAQDRMRPTNAPCYGFVAEALAGDTEVVMVAYGARRHHPKVTAAPLDAGGVGDFAEPEDLHPAALPFLHPLQQAAEAAGPPDVTSSARGSHQ